MDKNTITGFILIAIILVGFSYFNRPSQEQIERQKRYNDSIALVEQQRQATLAATQNAGQQLMQDSLLNAGDSASVELMSRAFGEFSAAASGEEKFFTLENELVKLTFTNKGGRIYEAQLKNYRKHDSLPLLLFTGDESNMAFTLVTSNNQVVNTGNLFFEPAGEIQKDAEGNQTFVMRLKTTGEAYLDIVYTLPADDYMLGFKIVPSGMNKVMPLAINYLEMQWSSLIRQQEKGRKFEDRYSSVHYKFDAGDMEKMSESKNDTRKLSNKLKWIAFKDQFFSSILISEKPFTSASLESKMHNNDSLYLKAYSAEMIVPFDPSGKDITSFRMYLGPNKYNLLSSYDKGLPKEQKLDLKQIIPLGWGIFGWVSRWAIIPMFNLFSKFIGNYGIIILLMTLVIKLVLFPLTYKSYMSSAKMRVLKPEIDEIHARIPADKAVERQKATMELYKKVGVSPMSGCLPTMLQMPILFAMFSFFPASIELRHESFLWATDLSAYDSIMQLPFEIPFGFGSHISLFTLLMTVTSIIYTKLNMATTATPDQPGAGMMKWMMYLMPVMFMFMFNSYASGLSYYYFLSTLISIGQTYAIRATVDEKKLLAQLHAKRASNEKKPVKKSSFMERLEKMQYEQQKAVRDKNKKK